MTGRRETSPTVPETRTARCHCGAVVLRAVLPGGLASAARCTCSFCRRRGAAAVTAIAASVEILSGEDNLSVYSWGTQTAEHYFCKICGIYTHHRKRVNPDECGINLGCFDDTLPMDFEPIRYTDGINHPSDRTR